MVDRHDCGTNDNLHCDFDLIHSFTTSYHKDECFRPNQPMSEARLFVSYTVGVDVFFEHVVRGMLRRIRRHL